MKLNEPVKIFPGAQVIGDVEIGENCSIWHGAVIRGDSGPIKIKKGSNKKVIPHQEPILPHHFESILLACFLDDFDSFLQNRNLNHHQKN